MIGKAVLGLKGGNEEARTTRFSTTSCACSTIQSWSAALLKCPLALSKPQEGLVKFGGSKANHMATSTICGFVEALCQTVVNPLLHTPKSQLTVISFLDEKVGIGRAPGVPSQSKEAIDTRLSLG